MVEVLTNIRPSKGLFDAVIFPDPITVDAIQWLKSKQPAFISSLSEFAQKYGLGIERRREQYRGEFTGSGLCSLAVGVQEEALIRRYGLDMLVTFPYFIYARRKDRETYKDFNQKNILPHWILLFKGVNDPAWYFADPTYRQFLISVDPHEMLVGISVSELETAYGVKQTYQAKRIPSGELYLKHKIDIKDGYLEGVTTRDYTRLLKAFS